MYKTYNITNNLNTRRNIFEGIEPKFWITIDGVEYLYKYNSDFPYVSFGEVFVSALCKQLGIKCVDASFACGKVDRENTKGCLVKSFNESDIFENISLARIERFLEEKWDISNNGCTREKTPDNIFEDLEKYINNRCVIDQSILQELKIMTLFDYVTAQIDRHEKNIEFLVYIRDDKLHLKLAPMFDNGRCFGFALCYDGQVRKNENFVTGQRPVLVMDQYLSKNDNTLSDCSLGIAKELSQNNQLLELFEKMKNFDIQTFVKDFMQKTGEKIGELFELQIVETWKHKIEKIDTALAKYKDPQTREQILIQREKNRRHDYVLSKNLLKTDFHLNYFYDISNGLCTDGISKYMEQNEEYCAQVNAWQNCETDELKTFDDFPLLKKRCTGEERKYCLDRLNNEQFERKCDMAFHKANILVPNYIELDVLQELHNIEIGKSKKSESEVYEQARKLKVECSKKLHDWVTYGDALYPIPTFEDLGIKTTNKYDESVLEQYIMNYESAGKAVCVNYQKWLQSVGKTEFARKVRSDCSRNL